MRTTTIIILVVILLAVLAVGSWALQHRRTVALRRRFGDEYDRTVDRTGSRRQAEAALTEVAQRRDQLDVRPLDAARRRHWTREWDLVQSRFVDAPAEAVGTAHEMLPAIMRERGYPTDDADERTALLATDHPVVVGEYRAAEEAYQRHLAAGGSSTEALRQALVHYRALFAALVDDAAPDDARDDAAAGVRPDGARRDRETELAGVVRDRPAQAEAEADDAGHGRHVAHDLPPDVARERDVRTVDARTPGDGTGSHR